MDGICQLHVYPILLIHYIWCTGLLVGPKFHFIEFSLIVYFSAVEITISFVHLFQNYDIASRCTDTQVEKKIDGGTGK